MSQYQLQPHEVHLWKTSLLISEDEANVLSTLLSSDEIARANRFYFPIHRIRFIAARSTLRNILSQYLNTPPEAIKFSYHGRGKPYIENTDLQFNLSHSENLAVIALTNKFNIGVDVEKIAPSYMQAVAERFFTESENKSLAMLSDDKRVAAFYKIWARKEAVMKAIGEGLAFSSTAFSTELEREREEIQINFDGITTLHVESFLVDPNYQAAFATQQNVNNIVQQEFSIECGLVKR